MSISVALCTYNGEKYLREQLNSIAWQTLLPDELVVCDDRSSDATISILEDFRDQTSFPVHIHQNEINLGSTKNFEKVINFCTGEIIALCDQDDVWKPNKLEQLVEALDANPDAGYVFSDAELVDESLAPLNRCLWESVKFTGEVFDRFLNNDQFYCLTKQHVVTGATMAFRSHIGKIAMPFPEKGNWIHDGWIALISSSAGWKGIPINKPLIAYRQHSNQQIGAPDKPDNKIEKKESLSLFERYRLLKKDHEILFASWEQRGLRLIALKEALEQIKEVDRTAEFQQNLNYLNEFKAHFLSRHEILTSKKLSRLKLILTETFSGRYSRFSDSWRSIFRDLFL